MESSKNWRPLFPRLPSNNNNNSSNNNNHNNNNNNNNNNNPRRDDCDDDDHDDDRNDTYISCNDDNQVEDHMVAAAHGPHGSGSTWTTWYRQHMDFKE